MLDDDSLKTEQYCDLYLIIKELLDILEDKFLPVNK